MNNSRTLQPGFSLIDTLLGVGLFVVVTIGLIQLTLTTLHAADNLGLQIRAQNAAREGIEITENLRGTNAISHVIWSTPKSGHPVGALKELMQFDGLSRGGEVCATLEPTPSGDLPWLITPIPCPPADKPAFVAQTELFDHGPGTLFTHRPGGTTTGLFRYIRVRLAKNSPSLQTFWTGFRDTRGEPRPDDDLVEIEAVVSWRNHGSEQVLHLQKALADWYE